MVRAVFIVTSLITLACATPHLTRELLVHERRDTTPEGFSNRGPAPVDQVLRLRLALTQTDISGLQKALYDVSTPGSANYGQHLSKQEVNQYVAPKPESIAAVESWLSSNGLTGRPTSSAGDWYAFEATVGQANKLFDTQFSTFSHDETGQEAVRTLSYSLPAALKGHLELIHPTVTFPNPSQANVPLISLPGQIAARSDAGVNSSVPESCNRMITPDCVLKMYNVPSTNATQNSNQLGVVGFINQYANKADLQTFLQKFRPDLPSNTTFTVETLDGGSNPQNSSEAGPEANLDIQYTIGIASDVPTTFISVGPKYLDGQLDGFLDIINYLLADDSPPQVLTTSYGQDELSISRPLANALCNAYAQLGARGTSILFASGDGGVGGSSRKTKCKDFVPTFPNGCPFLTSVGATTNVSPEIGANFSAGGFSNYFDTPVYQVSAKAEYLQRLGKSYKGKFNASGRGFPDVSAIGAYVNIIYQDEVAAVAGTSCATPIFSSLVSLLNDRLIAAGKSPLGFLNPFLYSDAGVAALNDIVGGNNPGCNTKGFTAVKGWDPITGLGTPNFAKLLTAIGL